jgi:hypothetical protein
MLQLLNLGYDPFRDFTIAMPDAHSEDPGEEIQVFLAFLIIKELVFATD